LVQRYVGGREDVAMGFMSLRRGALAVLFLAVSCHPSVPRTQDEASNSQAPDANAFFADGGADALDPTDVALQNEIDDLRRQQDATGAEVEELRREIEQAKTKAAEAGYDASMARDKAAEVAHQIQ
jgi:hypothetical protein